MRGLTRNLIMDRKDSYEPTQADMSLGGQHIT